MAERRGRWHNTAPGRAAYEYPHMTTITLEQADRIIDAAIARGVELNCRPISVIVVEPGCKVKAFKKEDGASMIRFEMAFGKAYAALALGRSSSLVHQRAEERPIFMRYLIAASDEQLFPEAGGLLIRDADGEVIGAVGVTGDTGERDEELAAHGIHAAGIEDRRGLPRHGPARRAIAENKLARDQARRSTQRGTMKIGLFDHIEDGARPLTTLFDERLQFAAAADAAGFYCLHLAEHHATPLNMVPVPGIFMGALARATKRMRMGPLVYLLPLYSPLRLIEEISMLDHLSYGRLDVGVGRGVSPYELKYHKVEHDNSRDIFIDAFKCLSAGLVTDSLSYKGDHYVYENVPIALRPLQQPHPPFWYASSNEIGSTWGGEHGLHFVTLGPMATAKTNIDAYKKALAKRGAPAQPKAEFPGGAVIGVQRHIFVADTDAEAHRFAKPAMEVHLANLNWLRVKHGVTGLTSRLNVPRGATYEACLEDGTVIAGSPATVRAEIERQVAELGVNYLLTYLFLGTMSLADALRSLHLFSAEVMPHLAKL